MTRAATALHASRVVLHSTLLLVALGFASTRVLAQGGPPLITDDPDTPGPGYWEINIATRVNKTHNNRRLDAPLVDLNYGVGRRVQLKFEMPWVSSERETAPHETGAGNATTGLKWRFLGQEGEKLAWSVYPQFEFNTDHASVAKQIESAGHRLLVPTEITLEISQIEINGEVGRSFVEHGPDEWVFGLSMEAETSRRLELLAELHGERVIGEATEVIAVGGGRVKLTSRAILLMAIGHTVRSVPGEGPRTYFYAGLQLNLPRQFSFEPVRRGRATLDVVERKRLS